MQVQLPTISRFNMTSLCDNNTNNPIAAQQMDTAQGLAYSAVFLLGFLVNAAALHAFIARRASWTDTHIYMLNLVIADTSLILFLPFRIYHSFFRLPETYFCTFLIYLHFINMYASILTTTAISVHRYLVIRFPLRARTWKKKKEAAFAVCLLIWGFLVTTGIIYREENSPNNLWTCFERCKNHPLHLSFLVIMVFLGYIIPLLIVVFCSSCIIRILLKAHDKSGEMKSIIGIVTANMLVFIVCYTPIHVSFVVNYYNNVPENWQTVTLPAHMYLLVSEWIASTNCCFDSISYYFLLKRFYS